MHRWRNAAHLFPHYSRVATTRAEIHDDYLPSIRGEKPTHGVIASAGGTVFGYMQWYLNCSYPDYGLGALGREAGVSIDYFIGEPGFVGRGLGQAMLRALCVDLGARLAGADRVVFIGHAPENARAIRCTLAAGFFPDGGFVEDEDPVRRFRRDL